MRVFLTSLLILCCTCPAAAQPLPKIAGAYRLNQNHEPEGGTKLLLFPDGRYAVVYFGGIDAGRWTVTQDTLLTLTRTDLPRRPFALYGRHNPALGRRARLFAGGSFADAECYISLAGTTRPETMQRVFNEDANCFSYPYVDTVGAIPDSIAFTQLLPGDEGKPVPAPVYTFRNTEGYNDFLAGFSPEWAGNQQALAAAEPVAAVRPGGLYLFRTGFFTARSEMALNAEDDAFLQALRTQDPDPDSVLYNPRYKAIGWGSEEGEPGPGPEAYTYRQDKAALVSRDYVEGAENGTDFDFNDRSIVYIFKALRTVSETRRTFRPAAGSLFQAQCR